MHYAAKKGIRRRFRGFVFCGRWGSSQQYQGPSPKAKSKAKAASISISTRCQVASRVGVGVDIYYPFPYAYLVLVPSTSTRKEIDDPCSVRSSLLALISRAVRPLISIIISIFCGAVY